MSSAPVCDQGQLFVGFERGVLIILCDLTRLKTSKLSLVKLRRMYALVLPWPEFPFFS